MAKPIPVILDTDIGGDIDDTWALAMLLNSPELDVKLISTTTGNTTERAKVVARMLEIAGRTDIPIAIGRHEKDELIDQSPWVAGYDLARYPGKVTPDSPAAIIETIMASPQQVTVIAIGPVPDLADALKRRPDIAARARFVGMHGSVYRGYEGKDHRYNEYNVRKDPASARIVFKAPWEKTITPLDTCGHVRLAGPLYQEVVRSDSPLARAVIENYRVWLRGKDDDGRSSILFDAVAVYLAFADEWLEMRPVKLRITDDGFTEPDEVGGDVVNCALEWKDKDSFYRMLVDRVIAPGVKS